MVIKPDTLVSTLRIIIKWFMSKGLDAAITEIFKIEKSLSININNLEMNIMDFKGRTIIWTPNDPKFALMVEKRKFRGKPHPDDLLFFYDKVNESRGRFSLD
jgi:hypothetical protein